MKILEKFWYGNLDPAGYDTSPSPEYKELLQLISRNEEKLLATMTDTQKDLFSRYQDCVREFQATAECLLFQNSFCMGAKMMMAIYEEQIHKNCDAIASVPPATNSYKITIEGTPDFIGSPKIVSA